MRAIVYDAPRRFSYREIAMPELAPDEVLLRVRSCGICGTDLHIHEGEFLTQFPLIQATNSQERWSTSVQPWKA